MTDWRTVQVDVILRASVHGEEREIARQDEAALDLSRPPEREWRVYCGRLETADDIGLPVLESLLDRETPVTLILTLENDRTYSERACLGEIRVQASGLFAVRFHGLDAFPRV